MSAAVKPIPEGVHSLTPYLTICGASAAIDFYASAFGAVELMRMDAPGGDKVIHADLLIGDSHIYISEEFPEMGARSPIAMGGTPVAIHLYVEDVDATFAAAIEAGGTAVMPPMDMPWGDRWGKLTDPYGHSWSVATHIADPSPAEIQAGMEAMMAPAA